MDVNGGTNLHIHAIAQGRPEDNQVEFIQGPHGIVNPPKNLVLNNIRRFTQMANGLKSYIEVKLLIPGLPRAIQQCGSL